MNTNKEARWKGARMGDYYCSLCKEENLETIRRIKQSIKSARAEAVREFAEKVKYYADGYNWLEMTCSQVDEIVKEMTEGEEWSCITTTERKKNS